MTIELTREELEIEMRRYEAPLTHALKETVHDWTLGVWSLSKFNTTWRIGWGHELAPQARWSTFRFQWYGTTLIGLLFDSDGDKPAWYMAGWVREDNARAAESWVAFMNDEIADRLRGGVSEYNGRVGLEDDFQAKVTAAEIANERRRNAPGVEQSPRLKALFAKVDSELAEEAASGVAADSSSDDSLKPAK